MKNTKETRKFITNNTYVSTDWFTGGNHYYKCIDRTETTVTFSAIYHEIDGDHEKIIGDFSIFIDENGDEYVLFYAYKGHENRMYA